MLMQLLFIVWINQLTIQFARMISLKNSYLFSFRSSFVLERRKLDPNFTLNGKSKSLDDLLPPSEAAKKSKNISMLELGRANTYDDQVKTVSKKWLKQFYQISLCFVGFYGVSAKTLIFWLT
jgi:hypothetical protein